MVNKKIANIYGFSLLNTIIAVSLGAVIMAAIWQLYSTVSSTTGQARSKSLLTERSSMALLQLTDDIKISGSFGCFNGRIAGKNESLVYSISDNDFRQYESYGGLFAFVLPLRNIDNTLAGDNIVAGNDVLKLQYGVNSAFIESINRLTSTSTLIFVQPSYRLLTNIAAPLGNRYALESNGSTVNSTYVLASCSRFDQITGQLNANTLQFNLRLPDSYDQTSARLMNFVTKYYYIATINGVTGLYSRFLLPSGAMSAAQLVIPEAVGLTTQYEVNNNGSRQIKARANMLNTDWININQVILTLRLQSTESSGLGSTPLIESITQSILLR